MSGIFYKNRPYAGSGGSGGGASALSQLTDVNITSPSDGQILIYDSTLQMWKNESGGSQGVNYSTDEQVIGTWIDGKPLYQKTIIANNILVTTTDANSQFKHNVSNIKMGLVVEIYYDFTDGGTKWKTAHRVSTYTDSWVVGDTSVYIATGEYWNAQSARYWMATIRYTKTTD